MTARKPKPKSKLETPAPTPTQIRIRAAEIRLSWTPAQHEARLRCIMLPHSHWTRPYETPIIPHPTAGKLLDE